jgi:hypothetical protein
MTKSTQVKIAAVAIAVAGYAVYATFFLKKVPIGEMCRDDGACAGHCMKLLGGEGEAAVCTKSCTQSSECPAPTTCQQIDVTMIGDAKNPNRKEGYCLARTKAASVDRRP